MTLDELVTATGFERDRINSLIDIMNARGLVVRARLGCYRRTPAGDATLNAPKPRRSGPKGPKSKASRSGGLTTRLWSALRVMRKGTLPELLEIADQRDCKGMTHAQRYLRQLYLHGVTGHPARKVSGDKLTSPGFPQHVLLRDLGPKAPIWRVRNRQLLDANTGQIIERVQA